MTKNWKNLVCMRVTCVPLLRETATKDDEVDLSNVSMSHYRLSKIRQQDIKLKEDAEDLSWNRAMTSVQPSHVIRRRVPVTDH